MFVEAVMALKEALSCHDYVNLVDSEKSQLLREHEKLRNEMHLLADENEKLKRLVSLLFRRFAHYYYYK